MEVWESRLIEDLNTIIRLNVNLFGKITHKLDEENRQKWIDTLKDEIHETCSLFVEEATFFVSIQYLRSSCLKLCDLLQIEMPTYDSEKLTLYEEKKLLDTYLKEFEEEIKDKQAKFKELTVKQVTLCRRLEKIPMTFVENTIPTNAELQNLLVEINKLETEWQEIQNKFYETKTKIENILKELNIEICKEIQLIITPNNNAPITITKDSLQLLINYYEILEERQKREEHSQLESLESIINDMYDSCHIAIPDRHITEDIYNHSLDEIQQEISKLKSYWVENEEIFHLFEKYNQNWMKLSKLTEECQKYENVNRKVLQISNLCEQIHRIEDKLIDRVMHYETKHTKPFTTFGQTIPDVIAKLHDSLGKFTITEINIEKTLSSIISRYEGRIMDSQYKSVENDIDNALMSCDSNTSFETEFIENEDSIKQEIESIKEDSPLLMEREITTEEQADTETSMLTLDPNIYNSRFDVNIPSYPSILGRESKINVNINNQDTPVQVSIFVNAPSSSNATLKLGKSKNCNKFKTEKITPYKAMPGKNRNATVSKDKFIKAKVIEVIRSEFDEISQQ